MNEVVKTQFLGRQQYSAIWQQQKEFTYNRDLQTVDQIWLLEHDPVYTQGQAGKPEHLIDAKEIPVVQSDRGGQITYHGPGQLIVYLLTDIGRKKLNIRQFVTILEQAVIDLLASYNITATTHASAPGVYVDNAKICSLGLRVRKGRTYHGLSLNVAMDLEPFTRINPCGYKGMQVVQLQDLCGPTSLETVGKQLLAILTDKIGYAGVTND